jgi:hypothetical protein
VLGPLHRATHQIKLHFSALGETLGSPGVEAAAAAAAAPAAAALVVVVAAAACCCSLLQPAAWAGICRARLCSAPSARKRAATWRCERWRERCQGHRTRA